MTNLDIFATILTEATGESSAAVREKMETVQTDAEIRDCLPELPCGAGCGNKSKSHLFSRRAYINHSRRMRHKRGKTCNGVSHWIRRALF
ncbi:MAG: hypothetical protein ABL952_17875, partial [Pyrinomonadaceae bacterium]